MDRQRTFGHNEEVKCGIAVCSVPFVFSDRRKKTRLHLQSNPGHKKFWCGRPDLNRHRPFGPTDFKSVASTDFATPATPPKAIAQPWKGGKATTGSGLGADV